jgi:NitT/TauT family transport system ATP-binding protein
MSIVSAPHAVTPAGFAGPRSDTSAPHIVTRGVAVDFVHDGLRQRVLTDIDLAIPKGSFVSLIGASGCGKSTLLKVLAGLLRPTHGDVTVAGLAPQQAARQRMIGLVFQDATLLPCKNALENAAFLHMTGERSTARDIAMARARDMLRLVGLDGAEGKRPAQLSGGMRQRVAIARALALDPEVLLMDEPFGALDAITREEMRQCLLDIWERTGKTVVLVTHSIDEAVFLSREVHVLGGRPARIVETIAVTLPDPRTDACLTDPAFTSAEARLRALLIESHHRTACSMTAADNSTGDTAAVERSLVGTRGAAVSGVFPAVGLAVAVLVVWELAVRLFKIPTFVFRRLQPLQRHWSSRAPRSRPPARRRRSRCCSGLCWRRWSGSRSRW